MSFCRLFGSYPDRTRTNARGIPGILKRALQPLRRRRRDREALEPFAYGESAEMGEINPQEVADALDSAARWRQDPTAVLRTGQPHGSQRSLPQRIPHQAPRNYPTGAYRRARLGDWQWIPRWPRL